MASFWTAISLPNRPGGSAHNRCICSAVSGAMSDAGVSRSDTSPSLGHRSTDDISASHASNSAPGWAMTTKPMLAWCSPQNSAHTPRYVPGSSASMHERVGAVREGVELAGEVRHPEAVDHVGRGQPQLDPLADRDVHLVGDGDVLVAVRRRPRELTADDVDDQAVPGPRQRPHRRHAGGERDDEQDHRQHDAEADDPARRRGRRDVAVLGRWRLPAGPPLPDDRRDQQHDDEDEHGRTEHQEQPPQSGDAISAPGRGQEHSAPLPAWRRSHRPGRVRGA